jgi:hypothetical protein
MQLDDILIWLHSAVYIILKSGITMANLHFLQAFNNDFDDLRYVPYHDSDKYFLSSLVNSLGSTKTSVVR